MIELTKVVRANGKVAKLRHARKNHNCTECPHPIERGTDYYEVVIGGGGLGDMKFPDRTHPGCLDRTLRR